MQRSFIKICALTSALLPGAECAAKSEYNTAFFHGVDAGTLINLIDPDSGIIPGIYALDVYVNQVLVEQRDIELVRRKENNQVRPCLSTGQLQAWSVGISGEQQSQCVDLASQFPGASMHVTIAEHRLDIQVPQLYMNKQPRGAVPATLYDEGVTAAFINYNLVANNIKSYGENNQYAYLYLNSGLNLGAWRLRSSSNLTKNSGEEHHWQNVASWAERALPSLQSRLIFGQTSTGNTVFDSVPYRGLQLASEQMMRADSQSQYAPVVRGMAESNARVEVRQNNYLIYSTNVSPGPFEFNDIVPASRSGDLLVTIIEADGRHSNLVIPYTVLPGLVRYGQYNYELVAGKYHDGAEGYSPSFAESQLSYGVSNTITLNTGALTAEHYSSVAAGLGKNMGNLGAVSFDLALSDTRLARGDSRQGASARFLYAKSFIDSHTDFVVGGYRYSSSGYYDFQEAVEERRRWDNDHYKSYYWDEDENSDPQWIVTRPDITYQSNYATKKDRLDVSVNQQIGELSQLYFTFSKQNYWQGSRSDTTVQSGLSSVLGKVTWSLYYQNTRNHYTANDSSLNLRLSLPLNFSGQPANATADFHSDRSGKVSSTAGLSGSLLEDNRLSYSVQAAQNDSERTAGSAGIGYRGHAGNLWLGYASSEHAQQSSLNLSGGLVAHSGGLTLSQPLGSTFTLIEAENAQGVGLKNQTGNRIDPFGYTVAPNAIPYRNNVYTLNTHDFPDDLDVPVATKKTVPTRGAITRIRFETYSGGSLLIHSRLPDNSFPPVGSQAYSRGERSNGIVGPDGDVFVSGVEHGETLVIRWGDQSDEQCLIQIPEDEGQKKTGYRELSAVCQ
ncbi:fimbrial biogenesis outer membrane usher protein [Enterobacteriaceae bacterium H4N4]|uniref:Fimbrial biogenesis outer membrane usher protein n=1 Tax=Silvania confinis TaxID=2926470 RepID=A0A9J6Q956_9ENTR|nr:fimbria/pilus outer membrane usher protein [Silvania confinis]MCU6668256.1 fimbrial biogenesis outer membrane usher protein [Silvania confinis]